MLLGVVSDTHGDLERTRDAVRMLESLEVAQVLHCGDIGTPEIVELFSAWPTHFVFGNCDHEPRSLRSAIEKAGQTCHERFGSLELDGLPIAILHGDDTRLLASSIASGRWKMICHGHTHVARQIWENDTLVLNPGAVHRANPHSIAVVEIPTRTVNVLAI
jgi:hypothetical protein